MEAVGVRRLELAEDGFVLFLNVGESIELAG